MYAEQDSADAAEAEVPCAEGADEEESEDGEVEEVVQVFVYSYCYEDSKDEVAGVVNSLFGCVCIYGRRSKGV